MRLGHVRVGQCLVRRHPHHVTKGHHALTGRPAEVVVREIGRAATDVARLTPVRLFGETAHELIAGGHTALAQIIAGAQVERFERIGECGGIRGLDRWRIGGRRHEGLERRQTAIRRELRGVLEVLYHALEEVLEGLR